jgi:protein TonB
VSLNGAPLPHHLPPPGAGSLPPWRRWHAPARPEDPLIRVEELGRRSSRIGLAVGLIFALTTHGAGSARALSALVDMRTAVRKMRDGLHQFFWATYDVDVEKEKNKPKEEEPPPEPEPLPPPKVEPATQDAIQEKTKDPYDEPPPAPAEAAAILAAKQNPYEPVDLSDGFVSGKGDGPGYGYVSAEGTAKTPTFDPHAKVGGKEGGHGSRPVDTPKPKVSLARPAGLSGSPSWSCPFPSEADVQQINRATATIVVTVSSSGRPTAARVLSDPGYGFGDAAKRCALGRRYEPALDPDGNPVGSTTPPIIVRFKR